VSTVKINDKLTEFFATKLGVKQGTDNLSPNLFKIFINNQVVRALLYSQFGGEKFC
jgi:hypothetical protein